MLYLNLFIFFAYFTMLTLTKPQTVIYISEQVTKINKSSMLFYTTE